MPPLLYLLATCNLVVGTGAFGLTGILQLIATSLNVSVAAVGQSMTAYAIATALIAPVLLVVTGRWSRRAALQTALTIFATGLLVCAFASSLGMLLLGRVLMGAGAVLTPIAAGIAVTVVEPARRGKALSLTFIGMSMSYVVGLPLGAWAGLQFGWRVPLFGMAGATLLMLALVTWRLPADLRASGAGLQGLGRLLRHGEVVRSLVLTLLYFSAIFAVFAFIGPVLQALNPMSATSLSLTLMVFGAAGVVGTLSGGWANDRFGAIACLRVQLAVLVAMMVLLPWTRGSHPAMVAVLVVWGIAGFGMMAPTQSRLASISATQAPMLFSLNASMMYFGTALGAMVGGATSQAFGFHTLAWAGAVLAAAGGFSFVGRSSDDAKAG